MFCIVFFSVFIPISADIDLDYYAFLEAQYSDPIYSGFTYWNVDTGKYEIRYLLIDFYFIFIVTNLIDLLTQSPVFVSVGLSFHCQSLL